MALWAAAMLDGRDGERVQVSLCIADSISLNTAKEVV